MSDIKSQAEAVVDYVQAPKLFLISRQSLAHKIEGVKEVLRMADIAGAFAASDIDALLAAELGITNIMGVNKPFILVADFPFDIAVIAEGGQVFAGEIELASRQGDEVVPTVSDPTGSIKKCSDRKVN